MKFQNNGYEFQKMLDVSIEWGNKLREDEKKIQFNGYDDPAYNLETHKKILKDFLEYEQQVPVLITMVFFYGDIARAFLNVQDYKNALIYGLAYLEKNQDDINGLMAAYNVLADIATASLNFNRCVEWYKLAHPQETNSPSELLLELEAALQYQTATNLKPLYEFPNDLSKIKKPKTFELIKDNSEMAIRFLMFSMGTNRQTAMEYLKMANK